MKKTWTYETFSVEVDTAGMDPKDLAVLEVLEAADGIKVHQIDIARSKPWLGCHPDYEADLPIPDPTQSTLRGIRGRINRLRREYHVPILSEPKRDGGYWLPKKETEIKKNMVERRAIAIGQARGNLQTYDEMLVTFKLPTDSFFESYRKFLEGYAKPPPPPPKSPKKKKKKPPPDDNGQGKLGL